MLNFNVVAYWIPSMVTIDMAAATEKSPPLTGKSLPIQKWQSRQSHPIKFNLQCRQFSHQISKKIKIFSIFTCIQHDRLLMQQIQYLHWNLYYTVMVYTQFIYTMLFIYLVSMAKIIYFLLWNENINEIKPYVTYFLRWIIYCFSKHKF